MTCPHCNQLHRRAQLAEAALAAVEPERLAQAGKSGGNLGRSLLTWQATKALEEREEARAMAHELAGALWEELRHAPNGDPRLEVLKRYRAWREAPQ